MAEREDEAFTEDLDTLVPRVVGTLTVGGVAHAVMHCQALALEDYGTFLAIGERPPAPERDWALLRVLAPTLPDAVRPFVPIGTVDRWLTRATKATGPRGRGRRIALFRLLAHYRALFPGDRARDLRRLTLAEIQAWVKWGERVRAASLVDLAHATAWIHMDERSRKRWMEQMRRRIEGRAAQLPKGLDLSKLPPKARAVYAAYYGLAE